MSDVAPKDGRYPQINLNTGISIAGVAMLIGMVVWSVSVKNDVGYHDLRIAALESTVKEQRTALDSARLLSAQAETRLESRLTRMEIILQDVQSRLVDRDRRLVPPGIPP